MAGMVIRTRHYRMERCTYGHSGKMAANDGWRDRNAPARGVARPSPHPVDGNPSTHRTGPGHMEWPGYDKVTARCAATPRATTSLVLATGHGKPDETTLITMADQQKHGVTGLCILRGITECRNATNLLLINHKYHVAWL